MRGIARVVGIVMVLLGLFFAAQGSGLVMWPAESFMLARGQWVVYGLIIAALGGALIWLWRRRD